MPEFAPIDVPQGPLIQAHTPNLTQPEWPRLENVGGEIVAAAAKGAEINGRRQALEKQLLQMELTQQSRDIQHQLEMGKMAQAQYLGERRLSDTETVNQSLIQHRQFMEDKYTNSWQDYSNLLGEISQSGIKPGDPNYWPTVTSAMAHHPEGAMTPAGRQLQKINGNDHNKAVASLANSVYAEGRNIERDIKGLDWQGFTPTTNVFDNPDYWKDQVEWDPSTNAPKVGPDGNPITTGKKFVQLGQDQWGKMHYLTLDKGEYQGYQTRWGKYKNDVNSLPEQIKDPYGDISTYPVDTTGGGGAMPLPTGPGAKSQLVQHQPYSYNGKTYTWDGTNLVPQ